MPIGQWRAGIVPRYSVICKLLMIALCALIATGVNVNAQPAVDSTALFDDGPHVLLRNDSVATVIYLCNGEIRTYDMNARSALEFSGYCHDSAVAYYLPVKPPIVEAFSYENVPRIFAVSDIHGEFDDFKQLLIAGGVMDENREWRWGKGHLVINGDVFDRGEHVTECLWLIFSLEQQAKANGGRVHYVLGNHDVMVLQGDNRYIREKYLKGIARKSRIKHEDLFGPDMLLGRWLRTKHAAVRINSILFVHGGLSLDMVANDYDLERLNEALRRHIDTKSYFRKFDDEPKLLFGRMGPIWYRGAIIEYSYPRLTGEQLDTVLAYYDATAMVVGHTECDSLMSHYDGRIFSIDTPVDETGIMEGLLWEAGKFYRLLATGDRKKL